MKKHTLSAHHEIKRVEDVIINNLSAFLPSPKNLIYFLGLAVLSLPILPPSFMFSTVCHIVIKLENIKKRVSSEKVIFLEHE
jgi:hypothetical protein